MSETPRVLADFVGTFTVEGHHGRNAIEGRVLLGSRELVLVGPDAEIRLPLSGVLDIGVGRVPDELARYFDDCVTVAFRSDGHPRVAVVEAGSDVIERFTALLFKTQLNDSTVHLNHPARVGGRVTGGGFVPSTLYLKDDAVAFTGIDTPFRIDLDDVIGFSRLARTVEGTQQEAISVRHLPNGGTMTTELALASARRQNLLGRYLRLEYRDRLEAVRDVELSRPEKRLLVALHSGGSVSNLSGVLDVGPGEVSMLLAGLEEEGLIASTDTDTAITPAGRILIEEFQEDVNE